MRLMATPNQAYAGTEPQFLQRVADVKLHRINAYALFGRNFGIAQPVTYRFCDPPLSGRQNIWVRWAAS